MDGKRAVDCSSDVAVLLMQGGDMRASFNAVYQLGMTLILCVPKINKAEVTERRCPSRCCATRQQECLSRRLHITSTPIRRVRP
ncbi:hypothetical protein E2C01_056228 [Portunus trituberculatus]|uniref:Uncharacterized protein n=1 Tax=Portunus trituberculatus TaxID=210409 RepID=A0A5B7GXJ8_PORTR|nr:hypothetical protein [Portunus trituberculatus]